MNDDAIPVAAVPVLGYSTSGKVYPTNVQADSLLDAGCLPNHIWCYFESSPRAIAYYAQWLAQKHSAAALRERCESCGRGDPGFAIQVSWRVSMKRPALEVGLPGKARATLSTFHAICPYCASRWLIDDFDSRRTSRIAMIGALGCALTLMIIFAAMRVGLALADSFTRITIRSLLGLILALIIVAAISTGTRRCWVPLRVRATMPRCAKFRSLCGIFSRDGARIDRISDWRH
jgi:hypothetical protein